MNFPANGSWSANALLVVVGIALGGGIVLSLIPDVSDFPPTTTETRKFALERIRSIDQAEVSPQSPEYPKGTDIAPQSLTSICTLRDPLKRAAALRERGAQQAQVDIAQALREGLDLDRPQDQLDYYRGVYGEWAEIDPEAALMHARRHFESGQLQSEVISLAVNKWGADNPHDAWVWVDQNLTGPLREQAMTDLVIGWTRRAPANAADWLASTGVTSSALYTAAAMTWAEQDPEASLAWTASLPSTKASKSALNAVALEWARQDPQTAAAALDPYLKTANNGPELATILADVWGTSDPASTATWIETLPAGSVREQAAGTLATIWATHDIDAALAWVDTLESAPMREQVIAHLGTALGGLEPGRALDWLLSLPSDEAANGITGALNSWAATDAMGLYAWINDASDPQIADLARRSLGDVITQEDMFGAMDLALGITDDQLRENTLARYYRYWRKDDLASADEWFMLYGSSLDESSRLRLEAMQRSSPNPTR